MPHEKYLLIQAWGYGFWSDISHVLGQLLVAEISGRVPIVHWGKNSLFSDGSVTNAFEFYFHPVSDAVIADIQKADFDFWPPKWNSNNLTVGEINKMKGPFSCVDGRYLIGRSEQVVVGDFHTGVVDLLSWIPSGHRLHGMSVDDLYRYLMRRYLRPRKEITDKINQFYQQHLASTDFMAAHIRGSDKAREMVDLNVMNKQYERIIDKYLSTHPHHRIFLMTDDLRILNRVTRLYGSKIVATDCQRTNCDEGVHYQPRSDKPKLGIEVMTDTYLAAKARFFAGNGLSNTSVIVRYLKDWPDKDIHLFGGNMYHVPNEFLLKKVFSANENI